MIVGRWWVTTENRVRRPETTGTSKSSRVTRIQFQGRLDPSSNRTNDEKREFTRFPILESGRLGAHFHLFHTYLSFFSFQSFFSLLVSALWLSGPLQWWPQQNQNPTDSQWKWKLHEKFPQLNRVIANLDFALFLLFNFLINSYFHTWKNNAAELTPIWPDRKSSTETAVNSSQLRQFFPYIKTKRSLPSARLK